MATLLSQYGYEQLEKFFNYYSLKRILSSPSVGSIIFGALALLAGFGAREPTLSDIAFGLFGCFLFLEGILMIVSPSLALLRIDGITIIAIGIWNIAGSIASGKFSALNVFFAILGIFQIGWGRKYLKFHGIMLKSPIAKPPKRILGEIDSLAKDISKRKPQNDPNVIEFTASTTIGPANWKASLLKDAAIFVRTDRRQILLAPRGDVEIVSGYIKDRRNEIEADIRIRNFVLKSRLKTDVLEFLLAWREGEAHGEGSQPSK